MVVDNEKIYEVQEIPSLHIICPYYHILTLYFLRPALLSRFQS